MTDKRAGHLPGQLSGGEIKRVAIARAHNPRLAALAGRTIELRDGKLHSA